MEKKGRKEALKGFLLLFGALAFWENARKLGETFRGSFVVREENDYFHRKKNEFFVFAIERI